MKTAITTTINTPHVLNDEVEDVQRRYGIMSVEFGDLMATHIGKNDMRFLTWRDNNHFGYAHLVIIMKELEEMHVYDKYPVQDKIVVDVGAYYGETAIYFIRQGAKGVVAYEPYKSGELIYANCVLNETKNVKVIRSAIVHTRGIFIDSAKINHGATSFEPKESGIFGTDQVTMTLEDIAIQDAILKMDCEGAEHAIFESSTKETIRKFSAIMMEAHGRYDDLVQRLVECGFSVDEVRPCWDKTWMIYAHRD